MNCSRINLVVLRENALIALVEQPFPSVPVEQPFPGSRWNPLVVACYRNSLLSTLLTGGTTISQSDWWNNHFPVSEDSSGVKDSLTLMPSGIMTTLFWELPKPCTYHPTLPTDSVECGVYVPVEQPFPGYRWNNHFPVHDASEHVRCDLVDP